MTGLSEYFNDSLIKVILLMCFQTDLLNESNRNDSNDSLTCQRSIFSAILLVKWKKGGLFFCSILLPSISLFLT